MLGVLPPRLLQGHSPTGEPHCTALVQKPRSSGESLVTRINPGGHRLRRFGPVLTPEERRELERRELDEWMDSA